MKPLFSIIHPSARPGNWRMIYAAWLNSAQNRDFEYILVCDKRWEFESLPPALNGERFRPVWNTGRRCYVDAVNIGAQYATGDVLIVVADDQFPCEGWDLKLAEVLADSGKEVIEVSTGTPKEHERGILVMPILTRARFERLGFVLYPAYESMFADNDFCEMARRDDQIADARHLLFPHKHPFFDSSIPSDKAYEEQNRPEAYQIGGAILAARRESNFGDPKRKKLCILYPGETYSGRWVSHFLNTIGWMQSHFELEAHAGYCTNVYVTRHILGAEAVKGDADYVLWVDDDNLIDPPHVQMLLADLEGLPDIDFVAGWCGCHSNSVESPMIQSSVGFFGEEKNIPVPVEELQTSTDLMKIDWTGFPIVLMRRSSLARMYEAEKNPFAPIINPQNPYGFDSEDISFSRRAKDAGFVLAVDPRVRVPHLKLRDADISDIRPALAGISEKGEK